VAPELHVTIVDRQRTYRLDSERLGEFVRRLAKLMPPSASTELTVCLLSDRAMARLNREYRGKRGATDVLSFAGEQGYLGDIAVAMPTAARQAGERGHRLDREVEVLVLHGYLHLLGYDHETDDGEMLAMQAELDRRLAGAEP
jgi:probable rRNA maturation factor